MRIIDGWRRIDNHRGYINTTTEQNLVIKKKQYGEHYLVLLFPKIKGVEEGSKVSPEYPTETKAESYAFDWMSKHPKGLEQLL